MSIQSEIERITDAKSDINNAIIDKGVTPETFVIESLSTMAQKILDYSHCSFQLSNGHLILTYSGTYM